ncbi:hypothetical protein MLD38_007176 [Melastoma candidum]|uniref:Uncharacterized protein n=1 Tax=Melastoma candidum TaxID=119954 RepID=A0ACB9RPS1_9MYRT|nr:hypothetical protein MLD38_007176 [Melastoma candidum]
MKHARASAQSNSGVNELIRVEFFRTSPQSAATRTRQNTFLLFCPCWKRTIQSLGIDSWEFTDGIVVALFCDSPVKKKCDWITPTAGVKAAHLIPKFDWIFTTEFVRLFRAIDHGYPVPYSKHIMKSSSDPCFVAFHDEEWGVPLHNDKKLFELLVLSDGSPGLPASSLLSKPKLCAVIENARQATKVIEEFGSFNKYIWSFGNDKPIISRFQYPRLVPVKSPKVDIISKDLVRRGF